MANDEITTDDQTAEIPADAVESENTETSETKQGDPSSLGDPGKKALDSMKTERNSARKELNDLKSRLREFEDANKTEAQRLQESSESNKSRADKAEAALSAFQVAFDNAPEHASLAQVRAVAKRLRGESEEDLVADAQELYGLVAPAPASGKSVSSKPKESLRGGGDPDEEPEVTDPRKLAGLIPRR